MEVEEAMLKLGGGSFPAMEDCDGHAFAQADQDVEERLPEWKATLLQAPSPNPHKFK